MSCLPQGVSGRELKQVPSKTPYPGEGEAAGMSVHREGEGGDQRTWGKVWQLSPAQCQSPVPWEGVCGAHSQLPATADGVSKCEAGSQGGRWWPGQGKMPMDFGLPNKLGKGLAAWGWTAPKLPPAVESTDFPLVTRLLMWESRTTDNLVIPLTRTAGLVSYTAAAGICLTSQHWANRNSPSLWRKTTGHTEISFLRRKRGLVWKIRAKLFPSGSITSCPLWSHKPPLVCILRVKGRLPPRRGSRQTEKGSTGAGRVMTDRRHSRHVWTCVEADGHRWC